jgi:hypothetical protein
MTSIEASGAEAFDNAELARLVGDAIDRLPGGGLEAGQPLQATAIRLVDRSLEGSRIADSTPVTAEVTAADWLRRLTGLVAATAPSDLSYVVPAFIALAQPPTPEEEAQMSTQPEAATADSYAIGIPPGWQAHPLDAEGFERALADLRRDVLAQGASRTDARRLEFLQRQMQQQLLAENVQYVATMVSRTSPPDDAGPRPSVLLAGLVVTSKRRDELGAPVAITTGLLVRGLAGSGDATASGIDLEPPTEVALPAGVAVRLVRFHSHSVPAGDRREQVEFYERSYLVPHDDGQRLCVLQLVTPTIEYAEPMAELFDAIAGTLRIFYPGQATTFDAAERAETPQ